MSSKSVKPEIPKLILRLSNFSGTNVQKTWSAFFISGLNSFFGKAKNSFAILDEAQNATDTQIKMFLTRIGENSKIVINGDPTQIDLPNKKLSGLERSKTILGHLNEISIVDFDHKDVVRHPLVSKIVKAYSTKQNND